jgi:hypothetical protein
MVSYLTFLTDDDGFPARKRAVAHFIIDCQQERTGALIGKEEKHKSQCHLFNQSALTEKYSARTWGCQDLTIPIFWVYLLSKRFVKAL